MKMNLHYQIKRDINGQIQVNPLKTNSSNYYTLPYRPNLPFLIPDIRAL